jgi:hypothetical protein
MICGLTDEETNRFQTAAASDRLGPVVTLQCLGVRPEEVCGLRWRRDVNLTARTLMIQIVRTLVDGVLVEKPPKTDAGKRVLPLDDALVVQLRAFKALQAKEKLAAGETSDLGVSEGGLEHAFGWYTTESVVHHHSTLTRHAALRAAFPLEISDSATRPMTNPST